MDVPFLIHELEKNFQIFHSILMAYTDDDDFICWKPLPDKWSVLEITCHLIDEEKLDFRMRVKFALEHAGERPPSIDPQGWVLSRSYMNQVYSIKCQEFFEVRNNSINWLKGLSQEDWSAYFTHAKFGKFTAHYMLTNWVAHDYLHIKQITRLRYDYLAQRTGENLNYAGAWI